ncbi:DNRLRE domain-containing protein [Pyxidicoccus fallax]|uniref:DNRLRE domain-containing protein n=1 Tax=Pyxidicoccus fallax TaxID=394095 RepID=A0A848LFJ5_9BACT|nr:DNRLRE domain-containing protein [Pyxidicoccus fallax]NMO15823.1 DNRLRE domain-containing protein [Pyxidicoccus fallax]NPC79392.1 DNRLRE domain-containing protein [Pyxidicoccus fallax]
MSGWKVWQQAGRVVGATAGLMLLTHCGGAEETAAGGQPQAGEAAKQEASLDSCQPVTRYMDLQVNLQEDAHVEAAMPDASHPLDDLLVVDGSPQQEAYLRFQIAPHLLQDVTVTRARLQLELKDGSSNGPAIYRTSGSWIADTLTWNTRPARVGSALGDLGAVASNSMVEYDITAAITGAGTYDFALIPTSGDGVDIYSADSASRAPRVIVTVAGTFCERRGTGGDVSWSQARGGENDQHVRAMAMDSQGNSVVATNFFHKGNFGGPTFATPYGFALVKYAPDGTHQWSRVYVQPDPDSEVIASDLTVTPLGNILMVGTYKGEVDFGAGPLPVVSSYDHGFFVAKFSPTGAPVWAHGFNASGEGSRIREYAAAVATDANGSAIITGHFTGWLNLGGEELQSAETPTQDGMFLAKFSWEGEHQWSLVVPAGNSNPWSDSSMGEDVVTDAQGRIIVGGQVGTGRLGATRDSTPFVAAYSPEGALLWSRALNGARGQVSSLALLPGGNVAFSGAFSGSFDFAGTTLTSTPNTSWSPADGLVGVLTSAGSDLWAKGLGTPHYDAIDHLTADPAGNITFMMTAYGRVDLGGGVLGHPMQSAYAVARFSGSGAHRWSRLLDPNITLRVLAASPDGGTVVGGEFMHPITVDGTPYTTPDLESELLFLKFAP